MERLKRSKVNERREFYQVELIQFSTEDQGKQLLTPVGSLGNGKIQLSKVLCTVSQNDGKPWNRKADDQRFEFEVLVARLSRNESIENETREVLLRPEITSPLSRSAIICPYHQLVKIGKSIHKLNDFVG